MVRHGQAYVDEGAEAYEARFNQRRFRAYTKALKEMGYEIRSLPPQEAMAA